MKSPEDTAPVVLSRHVDVMRALLENEVFSNAVSAAHPAIPNGMDPPTHTVYRQVVDRYFTEKEMREFEPKCRSVVRNLPRVKEGDFHDRVARPFAVRCQCAFLGWPETLEEALTRWFDANTAAMKGGDRIALEGLASEFDFMIGNLLSERRGNSSVCDLTSRLLGETVMERPLNDAEIVAILRNWTAGEVGTIATAVVNVTDYLRAHPPLREHLRRKPEIIDAVCDEILRLHAPLATNRRITSCPVHVAGLDIPARQRVVIDWAAANRDPEAFAEAEQFRLDREPNPNLLYGAGIHVCPGAPLARLELRVFVEEYLLNSPKDFRGQA